MPPEAILPEMLRGAEDVQAIAQQARAEGQLALDTEFLWERSYAPILCLVQVATRTRIALVDPLEGGDISPLAEVATDPAVELVMHAPASDLLLLALRFDAKPTNVFDTQTAAGFVGIGTGLSLERVVDAGLGVKLQHNETFTNWQRRPLSETQLAYAADDVRFLLPLADEIRARLRKLGREAWAEDELRDRFGDPEAIVPDPERSFQKVARRGRLSGRQLAVLRELAAWREREARRRDLPREWLIRDPSLVELARVQPKDADALRRVRGVGNLRGGDVDQLLAAVRRGVGSEPLREPREPAGDLARRAAAGAQLGALLVRARCDDAGLSPELVATRAELEDFARQAAAGSPEGHRLLTGWRGELVGRELLELWDGSIALASSARPPHIVPVRLDPHDAADGPEPAR
jgi:ribonuclease D